MSDMSVLSSAHAVCVGDLFSTGCQAYVRNVRIFHTHLHAHARHSSLLRTRLHPHALHTSLSYVRTTYIQLVREGRFFMISTYARIFSFIQGFFDLKNRSAMMVSWWSKDHQKLSTGGLLHFPTRRGFLTREERICT